MGGGGGGVEWGKEGERNGGNMLTSLIEEAHRIS